MKSNRGPHDHQICAVFGDSRGATVKFPDNLTMSLSGRTENISAAFSDSGGDHHPPIAPPPANPVVASRL
jgi:hypothetical protein